MLTPEATDPSLIFIFKEEHLVDDRDFEADLNLHQGPADGFADMGGVTGLAAQNNSEADENRDAWFFDGHSGKTRRYYRNLERARDAYNVDVFRAGALQLPFRRRHHRIHIAGIVLRSDDDESTAVRLPFLLSYR